jgi:uncharacterized protein YlxP (DUF503 family)
MDLVGDQQCCYTLIMHIGALTIELHIPGCTSLKQKRSRLKPLLARLHKQFNVSAAELDHNDIHQSALIGCVAVSNDSRHVQRVLGSIPGWIETNRPDIQVVDHQLEML